KQIDRWVVFGNYTYNTAQGGPFGLTVADHSVTGGLAFLRPFHVNGEWSLGAVWAKPINPTLRDQYGIETYWKILFAEDLWVTPNLQLIFNPTYNTTKTVLAVGGIKLRLFF
ncbi:MAG: carbohydrate porin, partial [Deltaproteobacteria bacterium]|nr:carbohydrate porin [Deltaproteobacteria bacterium]